MSAARNPVLWAAAVLGGLSVLWLAIGSPLGLVTQIAIYTLYGAGVNLLVGYTGLVPFGASVFFGCASYAVAIPLLRGWIGNEFLALIFGILFSAVLALAIGALILRRRGLYFSLLTLAFSQIAYEVAFKSTSFTGGENGLQNVPRAWLPSYPMFHVFALATVIGGLFLLWRLAHSPFGRVLQALRDNEPRVKSLGYDTYVIRLKAFVLTGAIVGLAGGLLSLMLQGVYADNLSWQRAGDALLMTVLGGMHHFLGPLWGAITFILLEDRLSAWTENWWLIFAPFIMVFALASPEGMQGLAQRMFGRQRWTLTREAIPERPAVIAPFVPGDGFAASYQPVLTVRGLNKRFGSLVTAADMDLDIHPRTLHSLIGPNGAGKTTLFNMLAGNLAPDAGTIRLNGRDITRLPVHRRARLGISRSFQILSVFKTLTAFENVRIAVQAQNPAQNGMWRDAYDLDAINARSWTLLDAVGLADRAAEPCANLSHGEQRLLELAITLAGNSKILLLDEPLAGLAEADREIVGALIRKLSRSHAVLLIEHDIDRVLALSDRISVLHQGRLIADGAPSEVAADPAVIAAYLGAPSGGHAPAESGNIPASAKPVLTVENLSAGYDGSQVLSGIDLFVRNGEAVALLGRNGVGKTTLLRAITGTLRTSTGRITLDGQEISQAKPYQINRHGISIVPEGRRLFPNLTVAENLRLAARPGGASFDDVFQLFPMLRTLARSRAENLSGGERQMVAIARALMVPAKLILLDEPFEGLAPSIVREVTEALLQLRGKVAMVLVEHHAESVLPLVDRAYVLVNGRIAYDGSAAVLAADTKLQARLLGVVQAEDAGLCPAPAKGLALLKPIT